MDITREYAFGIIPFYRESLGKYIFFVGLTPEESGGFWKLPKGHKDFDDEEDTEAARRELFEETNIQLPKNALIESVSFSEEYFYEWGDAVVRKINTFWLGQVDEDQRQVVLDEKEFARGEWLSYEDVLLRLPENSKKMFEEANNFLVSHRV